MTIIGITTSRRLSQSGLPLISAAEAYVQAVIQAGATPLLIPLGLSEAALDGLLVRLDGVLFSGGGDIEPGYYNETLHSKIDNVDADRDRLELHLLRSVVNDGTPFLGICRGLQLFNVGLGGSLYADIAEQHPGAQQHDFSPGWPRSHLAHTVEVRSESCLGNILGAPLLRVNSLHHQAIRQLAASLLPTAYAPDGLVEAVELPAHPFGLAVQWHPEWLSEHAPMRALFRAFVEAAERKRDS